MSEKAMKNSNSDIRGSRITVQLASGDVWVIVSTDWSLEVPSTWIPAATDRCTLRATGRLVFERCETGDKEPGPGNAPVEPSALHVEVRRLLTLVRPVIVGCGSSLELVNLLDSYARTFALLEMEKK